MLNKCHSFVLLTILLVANLELIFCKHYKFNGNCTLDKGELEDFGILTSKNKTNDRISGGYDAKLGQYPSYVYLEIPLGYGSFASCGGTIISPTHILTAAHCVVDGHERFSPIYATPTVEKPEEEMKGYKSSKICPSKKFYQDPVIVTHDVAIIKLEKPIKMSKYVQPANLPDSKLSEDAQVYSVGLGFIEERRNPNHLQALPVTKVDCEDFSQHLSIICMQSNHPKFVGDACKGDSGGGLLTVKGNKQYVVGITSFGPNVCLEGCAGISKNAHVFNLREEIDLLLKECS